MDKLTEGLLWYVVFIFSTTLHEASHALAALRMGDPTAYEGGQVTMDPRPHIKRSPVGTIVFPVVTFILGGWMMGWASAPYDPTWAQRSPQKAALMALAGPASNLLLVIIALIAIRVGFNMGFFHAPDTINLSQATVGVEEGVFMGLAKILSILFSLNLILFVFNLLPLPPLDGSAILTMGLGEKAARLYLEFINHPGLMIFGILIAWRIFGPIFEPIHLIVINWIYPGVSYG